MADTERWEVQKHSHDCIDVWSLSDQVWNAIDDLAVLHERTFQKQVRGFTVCLSQWSNFNGCVLILFSFASGSSTIIVQPWSPIRHHGLVILNFLKLFIVSLFPCFFPACLSMCLMSILLCLCVSVSLSMCDVFALCASVHVRVSFEFALVDARACAFRCRTRVRGCLCG